MPERLAFTDARVAALEPRAKRFDVYDDGDEGVNGLVVTVRPEGSRVFYLVRKVGGRAGRVERIRLGAVADISVKNARTQAKAMVGKLALGENPADARRELRAEATLGQAWANWLEHQKARGKRSLKYDEWYWAAHLEKWAGRKLSAIRPAAVVKLHQELTTKRGPVAANRAVALLSSIFGWVGRTTGLANPCRAVERNPEVARDRYLSEDELKRFLLALLAYPNRDTGELLTLLLLLGVRRGALQAATWNEFDLASGLWRCPAEKAKAGRPQIVTLSEPALGILKARRARVEGDGWVFPSKVADAAASGHVEDIRTPWGAVMKAAKLASFTPHDLRRTHATWLLEAGADSATIAAALGHADATVTGRYRKVKQSVARVAANAVAETMLAAAELTPDDFGNGMPDLAVVAGRSKVAQFRRRRS